MALHKELTFFGVLLFLALSVSLIALSTGYSNSLNMFIRLLALNGFIALSVATIITPFLKEITLLFKKPFIRIHHYFAAAGLVLITLHPIVVAIQALTPAVFLPNVGSLYLFLLYGGRQALIIIYTAFVAVLLRRRITAHWRPFHALMYVALFFGILHGNLSGTDFQNTFVTIVFDALFVAALAAFALKRWQFYRIRAKKKIAYGS